MHTYIHVHVHTHKHTCVVFIAFIPIHTGLKDASDAALLEELFFWALDNPPPSHVLLISGDHYYATAISGLKSRGYDIVLICPTHVATSLLKSVNHSLNWSDVAMGTGIVA